MTRPGHAASFVCQLVDCSEKLRQVTFVWLAAVHQFESVSAPAGVEEEKWSLPQTFITIEHSERG